MFKLLPAICENADEFLGCKVISNVVRDIHVKCHLLFCNFLLRGTPLSILYRVRLFLIEFNFYKFRLIFIYKDKFNNRTSKTDLPMQRA